MKSTPDFIAELYYRTKAEGGRSTPVWSKYRPQIKFPFSDMQTSGQQMFIDKETVHPGDTVTAEITIISTEPFRNMLYPGIEFEFREGLRVIGIGKILEIVNKELLQLA